MSGEVTGPGRDPLLLAAQVLRLQAARPELRERIPALSRAARAALRGAGVADPTAEEVLAWIDEMAPARRPRASRGWTVRSGPFPEAYLAAYEVIRKREARRPTQEETALELGYKDRSGMLRQVKRHGLTWPPT